MLQVAESQVQKLNTGRWRGYPCPECGVERDYSTHFNANVSKEATCADCYFLTRRLGPGQSAFNSLLSSYKKSARGRNLRWDLTETQFAFLVVQPCLYCGIESSRMASSYKSTKGFLYTGVDRVVSAQGYISNNVVPACGRCNVMKLDLTLEKFAKHITLIFGKPEKWQSLHEDWSLKAIVYTNILVEMSNQDE